MKKVRDLMSTDVDTVSRDQTAEDAALRMRFLDHGSVGVVDRDRLVGVLTDRDIVVRVLAEGRAPAEIRVEEIMSSPPVTCAADAEIESAVELMTRHRIRRLPVMDRHRKLVGWLSLANLLRSDDLQSGREILAGLFSPDAPPSP